MRVGSSIKMLLFSAIMSFEECNWLLVLFGWPRFNLCWLTIHTVFSNSQLFFDIWEALKAIVEEFSTQRQAKWGI